LQSKIKFCKNLFDQVKNTMDVETAKYFAKAMIILSMLGTPIGEGYVVGKAFEAMGRNPEISNSLFTKVLIGVALCESTAIYALVAFFII